MHSNGLFMVRPKVSSLPSNPVAIGFQVEAVEVKGKKKSNTLLT